MGCMGSKPVEALDKEAVQQTARIDKSLKNDKKMMDRTIKILLLGVSPVQAAFNTICVAQADVLISSI